MVLSRGLSGSSTWELSQTLKAGLMPSMMQLRPLNESLFELIYEQVIKYGFMALESAIKPHLAHYLSHFSSTSWQIKTNYLCLSKAAANLSTRFKPIVAWIEFTQVCNCKQVKL